MRRKHIVIASVGLGLLVPAASAFAAPPILTVLFSNIQSSSTSDVPGIPGLKFRPGNTSSTAFDRPFVSPDGNRWVFGGFVDAATTADDVIVSGVGSSPVGAQVRIRAGDPTGFDPTVNYGIINTHMTINNAGDVAYSGTTSATSSQHIGLISGGTVTRAAQQGGTTPIAGSTWTATLNSANVTGAGTPGYQGTTTPTPTQQLTVVGSTIISQNGVTTLANQQAAPDQTNNLLTSNTFRVSDDGNTTMYRTTLNGPGATNTVVAVNNSVVAQLGTPVPGWSNTANISSLASEAGAVHLSRNGQYYALRGAVNDGTGAVNQTDFVLFNGNVVAATDQPIFAGATELFDDTPFAQTFFVNTTNNVGDYLVGGTTNNPDQSRNAVLVLNGLFEVAREFDPVDLDGNGIFDDNVFIDVFGNDDAVLTDDLRLYFVASLRDGNGAAVGNALIMMQIPEPASLSVLGIAAAGLLRRRRI